MLAGGFRRLAWNGLSIYGPFSLSGAGSAYSSRSKHLMCRYYMRVGANVKEGIRIAVYMADAFAVCFTRKLSYGQPGAVAFTVEDVP